LWKSRKRAFGAIGRLSPNYLTQDGVVPRSKLPEMMRFIAECSRKYQLRIPNVFHAGDGNLHPLILYDERDADQVRRTLAASNDILDEGALMGVNQSVVSQEKTAKTVSSLRAAVHRAKAGVN